MERPEAAPGVVEDAVEHHPHPAPVGRLDQVGERLVAAEQRIDREVVVRVISVVRRRREDRVQVERVDAQVLEIAELVGEAAQVAALEPVGGRGRVPALEAAGFVDAVTLGEPVGEDLVEDRIADPGWRIDTHRRDATGAEPCMLRYDARRMVSRVREMPGGIRLFLVYAFLILAGIGLILRYGGRPGDLDAGQLRRPDRHDPARLHDLHDDAGPPAQAGRAGPRPGPGEPDHPARPAAPA